MLRFLAVGSRVNFLLNTSFLLACLLFSNEAISPIPLLRFFFDGSAEARGRKYYKTATGTNSSVL